MLDIEVEPYQDEKCWCCYSAEIILARDEREILENGCGANPFK